MRNRGVPNRIISSMISGFQLLVVLVGAFALIIGFLWRIGYEFRAFRAVLSRARYISIYNLEISLEKGFWTVNRKGNDYTVKLRCSYPTLCSVFPLRMTFDTCGMLYRDDSWAPISSDYSTAKFVVPQPTGWVRGLLRECVRVLKPVMIFGLMECVYVYNDSKSCKIRRLVCKVETANVGIENVRCDSKRCEIVAYECPKTGDLEREKARFLCSGPVCLTARRTNEFDVVLHSVDTTYHSEETLRSFHEALTGRDKDPGLIPSVFRVKASVLVKNKLSTNLFFEDKSSLQATVHLSQYGATRRPSTTGDVSGFYMSTCFDPFSGKLFQVSAHNYSSKDCLTGIRHIGLQLLVRGVSFVSAVATGSNFLGEYKEDGGWNFSSRSTSITLTLLDKTRSPSESLLNVKGFHLQGSDDRGVALTTSELDIDVSARMLSKGLRVYLRLMSMITGPTEEETPQTCTPLVSALLSNTDPNYALLQRKFLTSMSTPSTPPLNESSISTATPGPSECMSRSTSLMSVSQSDTNNVKNWKAMERIMFEGGKVLMSFAVDQVVLRNKNFINLNASKFKTTSKISSTGTPVTTVCCDGFSVNDNVIMNGGLRIWIDGTVTSESSRVFCLVPPVSIRFDSRFAEIVENYFLELVEVLKLVNRRNSNIPTADTTKQFIEFLQVSSLQLELHAKEMLGVLSLDKAMINLTRSSVYKSNGIWDALETLTTQYREDVVSQWFSLLTRLDVSIGRPVSTARRLITDLFGRSESPANE